MPKFLINHTERAWWRVSVEVPIKVDFVPDTAHLAVLLVAVGMVHPSVGNERLDLAGDVAFQIFHQWQQLEVAQVRIWFRLPLPVTADLRRFIPLRHAR